MFTERLTLIVGLGNPGPEYARNRHNLGFRCLERLAQAHGLSFKKRQARAYLAFGEIFGRKVILAKPLTFVNLSGRAVRELARFYKIPPADILVIYDDLDLMPGKIRLRPSGGAGGHKGMRSIIESLGTQDFPRLRVGIGRPPGHMNPADYVLQDFSPEEEEMMEEVCDRAVAAVELFLRGGVASAMNTYN
ncbi:MAG: aminoacyl-tRNA hydrolase [Anaerolineae bacterium]